MNRNITKTDNLSSRPPGETEIEIDPDIEIKLEPIWSQSYHNSQDEEEFEIVIENDEKEEEEYFAYEMESESESTSKELQQNLQEEDQDQENSPESPGNESSDSPESESLENNENSKKRNWIKKCPFCPKMVSSGNTYIYHVNLHKGLTYNCACNKSFRTPLLLHYHQRDKCPIKHPNLEKAEQIKKDPLKIIKKVKDISRASSSSTNKIVWKAKCPICKKIVIKNYLKDHIAKHENVRNYKCSYQNCDFSAFYCDALNKHYKRVHNGNENEDQENQNDRNDQNDPNIDLSQDSNSEMQNDPIGVDDDLDQDQYPFDDEPESEEEIEINIKPDFNIYVESENENEENDDDDGKDQNEAGDLQEDSSGSPEEGDEDDYEEDSDKEKEILIKSNKMKNWVRERGRCPICKKDFEKYYLKDHMAKHENVRNYPCNFPNCNFSAFYSTEISKHYRKVHKNKKGKNLLQNLQNKKEAENDNKDDDDEFEIDSLKPTMNPQDVNFNPEKKSNPNPKGYWKERVNCEICQMEMIRANLKDHLAKHQNIKNYFCHICDHSTFYRTGLFSHYRNVHKCKNPQVTKHLNISARSSRTNQLKKIKKIKMKSKIKISKIVGQKWKRWSKCPICQKVLSTVQIKDHVSKHNNVKNWFCSICEYSSFYQSNLSRHYRTIHPGKTFDRKRKRNPKEITPEIPVAPVAQKSRKILIRRKRRKGYPYYERKFRRCTICQKKIPANLFQRHALNHENPNADIDIHKNVGVKANCCDICTFSSFWLSSLVRHYRDVHKLDYYNDKQVMEKNQNENQENEKIAQIEIQTPVKIKQIPEKVKKVEIAGPSGPSESEKERARKRSKNQNESGSLQENTSKLDKNNINLEKMKKRQNYRKERVNCEICGKELSRPKLKDHISKHQNIKNYFCQICDYSSFYSNGLFQHYKFTHKCQNPEVSRRRNSRDSGTTQLDKKKLKIQSNSKPKISKIVGQKWKRWSKCGICQKELSPQMMEDHMSKHNNIKNWFCTVCEYSTFYYLHFARHYRTFHPGKTFDRKRKRNPGNEKITPEIPVAQISREIKNTRRRRRKIYDERKFRKCTICQKQIPANVFQGHVLKHKNIGVGVKAYCCDICTYSSFWQSNLIRHYREVHKLNYNNRKPIMEQKQDENQENEKIAQIQTPVKIRIKPQIPAQTQKIEIAGPSGIVKNNKKVSMKGNGKQFACLICKESFTAFDSLKNHLQIHLNEPGPKINKTMDITEEKIAQIMNCIVNCDKCRQVLVQHGKYLEKASEESESQENESESEENSPESLADDDENESEGANSEEQLKNDNTQEDLQNSSEKKSEESPESLESVENSKTAQKAINAAELDKSKFCVFCCRLFSSRSALNYHNLAIHQDKFDFSCEFCDQKVRTEQKLKVHVYKFHPEKYSEFNSRIKIF